MIKSARVLTVSALSVLLVGCGKIHPEDVAMADRKCGEGEWYTVKISGITLKNIDIHCYDGAVYEYIRRDWDKITDTYDTKSKNR